MCATIAATAATAVRPVLWTAPVFATLAVGDFAQLGGKQYGSLLVALFGISMNTAVGSFAIVLVAADFFPFQLLIRPCIQSVAKLHADAIVNWFAANRDARRVGSLLLSAVGTPPSTRFFCWVLQSGSAALILMYRSR